MVDGNNHAVPVMSTITTFNEGAEAWGLHYKALKDAHREVHYSAAWSSLDVVDKEHAFNNAKHTGVMDGCKGSLDQFLVNFPEAEIFACSNHMGVNVKEKVGRQAKVLYYQAMRARTHAKCLAVQALMDDRTIKYLKSRTRNDNPKIKLFLSTAKVRGNSTSNVVEGTNSADRPARAVDMARAVPTLAKLQGIRFTGIQQSAMAYQPALPPRKAAAFETIKTKAAFLSTPIITNDAAPWCSASVPCSSGTVVFTTNIDGQAQGEGFAMHDVECDCSANGAREYGLPCAHCLAHAGLLGMAPEDIVNWKDTTVGWKRQYEGLTYPQVSMVAIQNSLCHDPKLQYPPLNAAKCGRPKKVGRIKSVSEQKRSKVRCTACGNAGHNRRSVKCSKHKNFGRGGV